MSTQQESGSVFLIALTVTIDSFCIGLVDNGCMYVHVCMNFYWLESSPEERTCYRIKLAEEMHEDNTHKKITKMRRRIIRQCAVSKAWLVFIHINLVTTP